MLFGEPERAKSFMENAISMWDALVAMDKDLSKLSTKTFIKKPVFKKFIKHAEKVIASGVITRQKELVKTNEGYDQIQINRMKSSSPLIDMKVLNKENSTLGIFQKRGIIDDIRRIERNTFFVNTVFYVSDDFYIQENLEVIHKENGDETCYTIRGDNNVDTINEYGELLFSYNEKEYYFNPVFAYILSIFDFTMDEKDEAYPKDSMELVEGLLDIQNKIRNDGKNIPSIEGSYKNKGIELFEKLKKKEALDIPILCKDKSFFSMKERYHLCLDYCLSDCYDAMYDKTNNLSNEEKEIRLSDEKLAIDAYYGASPSLELNAILSQVTDTTLVMEPSESFEVLSEFIFKVNRAGNAHSEEFFDRIDIEFERAWKTLSKINEAVKSLI